MNKLSYSPRYRQLPPPVLTLPLSETDNSLERVIHEHVRKIFEKNQYHKMNTARELKVTKTRLYGYLMDMGLHVAKSGYYGKRWPKYIKRQQGQTHWGTR